MTDIIIIILALCENNLNFCTTNNELSGPFFRIHSRLRIDGIDVNIYENHTIERESSLSLPFL